MVIAMDAMFERFDVSRESGKRLETDVQLLLTWQQRINLIGPATIPFVWERHILDSLQLLPLLPKDTRSLAELGSGAGIPGLVVAIAAGLEAHLYESNGKKPPQTRRPSWQRWRRCAPRPMFPPSTVSWRAPWHRSRCCWNMPSPSWQGGRSVSFTRDKMLMPN